jgi:predicted AAA+ superfamily ATPase
MNYIKRHIDKYLNEWKNSTSRKPLLIRGARQVGKTESIRHFAKQFDNFIEINFEENKKIHSLFYSDLNPREICENISAVFGTSIIEGKTLLFFDEIQSCIPAIQSLRFFYEEMPGLHVIAAGSLLEFALDELPSFGVGRIRSFFMYPLSFIEFLSALNENVLIKLLRKADVSKPLTLPVHEKLIKLYKKFLIIGGMPEAVSTYVRTRDLNRTNQVLDDLIFSYYDDFAKYKKRVPAVRLRTIFENVVQQACKKFVYTHNTEYNIKQTKEAIKLLIQAGLIVPVIHSSANGLPLGAEANYKKQKLLLNDTGLYLRLLGLDLSEIILADSFTAINKGSVAEMFVGLELLKSEPPNKRLTLFYWHREAKSSNAEVDYLIVRNGKIIPLEVKAGTKGAMQSLRIFMKEKNTEFAIRISLENFTQYDNIRVYPLYAVGLI